MEFFHCCRLAEDTGASVLSLHGSATGRVKKTPPYEKEEKCEEIYPQLSVISQEGNYHSRNEDDRIIEMGQAETTIKMYPSSKHPGFQADWRPVALTSIISRCFEKLVRDFICSSLPATLDPLQFAYRQNRSTDDAIALTLHTALSHLDKKNTYVGMLFVDYSSAFNTIVPSRLDIKLRDLGLNSSLCSWILNFLTDQKQVVKMAGITSSSLTLSTGAPQGCVLSPLLYSLYTHDCTARHSSNVIIKFADDTTIVGLISNNNEEAYREEVSFLTHWCRENNLSLNVNKTKELIVDFRKQERVHTPITINGAAVERVSSFKFLGVHITEELTWTEHITQRY
ncbi:hypothetical protein NFI96_001818 [Prochilodus magdalenae]|nr:hypothetical protein NFI96_001818 [Prochilodus magdalenae]